MATQPIKYTKLTDRDISFGLIRTNPKLTSNIKLTVDSNQRLWLNSIDAVEQLSNQKYKKFPIDATSTHAVNIHQFYDSGATPTKISFALGSSIRTDVVANDLKDQYDFDLYSSGAKYLSSKLYSEKFTYFAPLYLDKVLPEYFVIFKVAGPSNYTVGEWNLKIADPNFSQTKFAIDLFKKSTIVRAVPMGPTSNIGKYLRGIQESPLYSMDPLYVNFNYDKYSVYRGISINSGTYTEMPEKLYTILGSSIPQLKLEQQITGGFERNNLIYPRIINLEFLFNDNTSEPYTFNRYFGFYCNAIDLATFDLDLSAMYKNPEDNDNPLSTVYDSSDELSVILENPTGVVIRAKNLTSNISDLNLAMTGEENMFFPYLKTKDMDLHFLDLNSGSAISQLNNTAVIKVDDAQFDIGLTFGPGELFSQEKAIASSEDTHSTLAVTINSRPNHLDTLRLFHSNGYSFIDANSQAIRYDDIKFVEGYFLNGEEYSIGYPNADLVFFNRTTDPNNPAKSITSYTYKNFGQFVDILTYIEPNGNETVLSFGKNVTKSFDAITDSVHGGENINMISSSQPNYIKIFNLQILDSSIYTKYCGVNGTPDVILKYSHTELDGGLIFKVISGNLDPNINFEIKLTDSNGTSTTSVTNTNLSVAQFITGNSQINFDFGLPTSFYSAVPGGPGPSLAGVQYQSTEDSSNWLWDGVNYVRGVVGANIYINLDNNQAASKTKILLEASLDIMSNNSINLTWTIPALPITSFIVERRTQDTSYSILYTATGSQTQYTDATANQSNTFIYRVRGYSQAGELLQTSNELKINTDPVNDLTTYHAPKPTDIAKLAQTLIKVVKNLKHGMITGNSYQTTAFIQMRAFGDSYGQLAIQNLEPTDLITYPNFNINGVATTDIIYADGGFLKTNHAIVPSGNISKLTANREQLLVRTDKGWSTIDRICHSADGITNALNSLDSTALPTFLNKSTLMVGNREPLTVAYSKIEIRKRFKPSIGVLSLFEIKDFDFNTHETSYSRIPQIDLYEHYFIPANTKILDFTKYIYEVKGEGSILVNDVEYYGDRSATTRFSSSYVPAKVWQNTRNLAEYTVTGGNPVVVISDLYPRNQSSFTRKDLARLDEDNNLQSFSGFFAFGADHAIPTSNLPTYEYRDKYIPNNLLSEYQVYLENYSKEFAIESKVIPYISKWGIPDSTDSRDNPYRLSTDIMFGKDNFGPSHRETYPTPEKLTHEWFYIESDFNWTLSENLIRNNHYYFNEALDLDMLISDPAYFEKYFTYIPKIQIKKALKEHRSSAKNNPVTPETVKDIALGNTVDPSIAENIEINKVSEVELDRPQFRYSKLKKDKYSNLYETVFNGAKYRFSELDSTGKIIDNSTRFEDYNFSVLLKVVTEDLLHPQNPVQFKIIENTNAKSILILVELAVSSIEKIHPELLRPDPAIALPDLRVDQTTFLNDAAIFSNRENSSFTINAIYRTAPTTQGDAEFNTLLTRGLIEFNNISMTGTAIEPVSGQIIPNYKPSSEDTIIIVDDFGRQFIMTFEDSSLYTAISNGEVSSGCQNINKSLTSPFNPNRNYDISSQIDVEINSSFGTTARRLVCQFDLNYRNYLPSPDFYNIPLINGQLQLKSYTPAYLSVFGDYRIKFSASNLSNINYAFLYSAKDKKYNSTKSAFSTIKLANGINLSPGSTLFFNNERSIESTPLPGVQSQAYRLEDFLNPESNSQTTFTLNTSLGYNLTANSLPTGIIAAPLPSFAPLMFIDSSGIVSILVNTQVNDLTYAPDGSNETAFNLQNPLVTSDAIAKVSENLVTLENAIVYPTSSAISNIPISVKYLDNTSTLSDIDLSLDYNYQTSILNNPAIIIEIARDASLSDPGLSDIIRVEQDGNPNTYFIGRITSVTPDQNTPPTNLTLTVNVIEQSTAATSSVIWSYLIKKDLTIISPTIKINSGGNLTTSITQTPFPANSAGYWLNLSQQFQLFGGKGYFANLFQNISFANFIKLIEGDSSLISWETYTNGRLVPGKKFKIDIPEADTIVKSTILSVAVEQVETKTKTENAGVTYSETQTKDYEINRYSGEYDSIFKPISGFKYETKFNDFTLDGANVKLNSNVSNFFFLPEFYYVKFSKTTILDLEGSQKYEAKYPLIGESPIDRGSYNILSSSWDANYHYEYFDKLTKTPVPGSRRITEDYSFMSKLLNVPLDLFADSFNVAQVSQKEFEISDAAFEKLTINSQAYDIIYAVYDAEFRLKLNFAKITAKTLANAGVRTEFEKFFRDESDQLITQSDLVFDKLTLEEYLDQYCRINLVKLYYLDQFDFYELDDATKTRDTIEFLQIPDSQLAENGYRKLKDVKINNTGSNVVSAIIPKKANAGIRIVPKLKIKYI